MTMSNVGIRVKLAVAFGVVLFLLIFAIGLSILNMSNLNKVVDTMVNQDFVKTQLSYDALDNVRGSIARVFEQLNITDTQKINYSKERLQKNIAAFDTDLSKLGQLVDKPESKDILAKALEARSRYVNSIAKVRAALDAGNHDEASKIAYEETYANLHAFATEIRTMADFQRKIFTASAAENAQNYTSDRNEQLLLGVLALILGVTAAIIISRSITEPLDRALGIAVSIASGDLSMKSSSNGTDEVGKLLDALQIMNTNLAKIVTEVRVGTDNILTSSAEIAQGNSDLSARTETQAGSLEETAASLEELTSTVKQNADNSREANKLSQQASDVAANGGAVVSQVVATMGDINNSAKKIVDIISVIDGIAFQTNILALNAAVEAARAGEQGRGFAVVASEVRSLAQRSASAAKEIKELIGDSVEKVDIGSKLVNQAGTTMEDVVSSIRLVTDIMSEISAASQEQSQGIDQINRAIADMDDVTQQNAALVEQATASSISLQEQASKLVRVVSTFNLDQSQAGRRNKRG